MVGKGRLTGSALAAAVAALAALAGCGGGDDGATTAAPAVPAAPSFPASAGRTLTSLRAGLGPGPRLATSVSVLEPGHDRVAFALFDRGRRQIADAPTALYTAAADGTDLRGPFRARYQSLAVERRFLSATSAGDADSARSIYVASPAFRARGEYRILAVAELDGRLVGTMPVPAIVLHRRLPPRVGDRAPRVHTPTRASVHGDLASIDTRRPHDSMHEVDLADVLGRRPVLLLFATPGLCKSRICGPVTDVVEQLKAAHEHDAAFIHMEIWEHNRFGGDERPQVHAFGLPSEPWLFAIDRRGRVAARIEGAFSLAEARRALEAAVRGGG